MIDFTEKAADQIKFLASNEGLSPSIRARILGGGCSGFRYDLFFDEDKTDTDQIFTDKEVSIIVDMMSYQYLEGTTIDYVDGLTGAGFKFVNPNAKSTCGCGSSFRS